MRWAKIFLIVIGSAWFIPVSCTTGGVLGTYIAAALDRRDVLKGEQVHALFKVAAEPGDEGRPFCVLSNPEKKNASASFRMSRINASIEDHDSTFSYRVIEDSGQEQLIELVETKKDGDNTIWSRYKATDTEVTPLSSRMFYFGYMFAAIPYALACALLLTVLARVLRRVYFRSRDSQKKRLLIQNFARSAREATRAGEFCVPYRPLSHAGHVRKGSLCKALHSNPYV